jgi:hypothetical protein
MLIADRSCFGFDCHLCPPFVVFSSHFYTMSLRSSNEGFVDQNLLDEFLPQIEWKKVSEANLAQEHFDWLLGAENSLRISLIKLGMSAAFSQTGGVPAFALARASRDTGRPSRCLIISPYSPKPGLGKDKPRDLSGRQLLESAVLANPDATLFAFDLADLILLLHHHLKIHISNAIDIQSALPLEGSRSYSKSLKFMLGDTPMHPKLVKPVFTSLVYEDSMKATTSLVQRAWLSAHASTTETTNLDDIWVKAPKVDTSKLSDKASTFIYAFLRRLCSFSNSTHWPNLHTTSSASHLRDLLSLKTPFPRLLGINLTAHWRSDPAAIKTVSQRTTLYIILIYILVLLLKLKFRTFVLSLVMLQLASIPSLLKSAKLLVLLPLLRQIPIFQARWSLALGLLVQVASLKLKLADMKLSLLFFKALFPYGIIHGFNLSGLQVMEMRSSGLITSIVLRNLSTSLLISTPTTLSTTPRLKLFSICFLIPLSHASLLFKAHLALVKPVLLPHMF